MNGNILWSNIVNTSIITVTIPWPILSEDIDIFISDQTKHIVREIKISIFIKDTSIRVRGTWIIVISGI